METKRPGARIFRVEAFAHDFVPDAARGAVLGDFLEEVAVGVEEKGEMRSEIVDVEAAANGPVDIFDSVAKSEGEFLNGGGTGFADVIAADGDDVEFGSLLGAEFESVDDEAHGRARRVDVFLLRDVFLEDVVLNCAADVFPVRALLFSDGEVHRPDDGGGRIDGHGSSDVGQWDFVEK